MALYSSKTATVFATLLQYQLRFYRDLARVLAEGSPHCSLKKIPHRLESFSCPAIIFKRVDFPEPLILKCNFSPVEKT